MAATEVPMGNWTLPPQQNVLQKGQSLFDLDGVASHLTVVMTTSVGSFTPSTDVVVAALESVQSNVALRWCKKILVFDKVPSADEITAMKQSREFFRDVVRGGKWEKMWNEKRSDYDTYCDALRAMKQANHPALFNTDLVFLDSFGHLYGTVKKAFDQVTTPYVFVTQHDLRLGAKFAAADVQNVVEALHRGLASYVLLNRDINSAPRTGVYFNVTEDSFAHQARLPLGLQLTPVSGFSDQAHFVDVDWYRQEVLHAILPAMQRTCMEHVLHEQFKTSSKCKGTYLFGGIDDGPFVYDLIHGITIRTAEGRLQGIASMPARDVPS